jgi:hypothetical protein
LNHDPNLTTIHPTIQLSTPSIHFLHKWNDYISSTLIGEHTIPTKTTDIPDKSTTYHCIRKLRRAHTFATLPTKPIQINIDGGASWSLTNDKDILIQFQNIKKYAMEGSATNGPAIQCTGKSYIPWRADNLMYYFSTAIIVHMPLIPSFPLLTSLSMNHKHLMHGVNTPTLTLKRAI